MTKTKTKPALRTEFHVTGGATNKAAALSSIVWHMDVTLTINPIDAPDLIPAGSSDAYGGMLILRSDLC